MTIDILAIGCPALADTMLTQRAPDLGWSLHRPGGGLSPEVAERDRRRRRLQRPTVDAPTDRRPAGAEDRLGLRRRLRPDHRRRPRPVARRDRHPHARCPERGRGRPDLLLTLGTLRRLPAMDAYIRAGRWVSDGPPPLSRGAGGPALRPAGPGPDRPGHRAAAGAARRKPRLSHPQSGQGCALASTCRTWSIWRPRSMC